MEQQPASLEQKASATVTSAIPLTRDATPWPNTVPASTFICCQVMAETYRRQKKKKTKVRQIEKKTYSWTML